MEEPNKSFTFSRGRKKNGEMTDEINVTVVFDDDRFGAAWNAFQSVYESGICTSNDANIISFAIEAVNEIVTVDNDSKIAKNIALNFAKCMMRDAKRQLKKTNKTLKRAQT